ncbi:MAG: hypothetical protein VB141_11305 [Burkholderia gladioli]
MREPIIFMPELDAALLTIARDALSVSEAIQALELPLAALDVTAAALGAIHHHLTLESKSAIASMSPEERANNAPPLSELHSLVMRIAHHALSVCGLTEDSPDAALAVVMTVLEEIRRRLGESTGAEHAQH